MMALCVSKSKISLCYAFLLGIFFFMSGFSATAGSPPSVTKQSNLFGLTSTGYARVGFNNCDTLYIDSSKGYDQGQGISTFDHIHNRYFWYSDSGTYSLIRIFNVSTRKFSKSIDITGKSIYDIQYDDSNNTLYCIDASDTALVAVNLDSMTYDTICHLGYRTGFSQGMSFFDQVHGRYFDMVDLGTGNYRSCIMCANVHTGKVTFSKTTLSGEFEYCNANGKLYGFNGSWSGNYLCYDLVTDTYTVVKTPLNFGFAQGMSTFDEDNSLFVFVGSKSGNGDSLYYLDTSGNVGVCGAIHKDFEDPEWFSAPDTAHHHSSTYTVKGTIKTCAGGALKRQWVYLLVYNAADSILSASDSVETDSTGHYEFHTTDSTAYIGASPDSADYPNDLGTYYDSSVTIQSATLIHTVNNTSYNFSTICGTNNSGGGFIGGKVTVCYCKKAGKGQPVAGLRVLLADNNGNVVKATLTDKSGSFGFPSLTKGNYKIWVDYKGIDNSKAPLISLASNQTMKTNLNFQLYPTYLQLDSTVTSIENVANSFGFHIYPNPFSKLATIDYTITEASTVSLKVYNFIGKEIDCQNREIPQNAFQSAGTYTYTLDAGKSNLASGIYMLKLTVDGVVTSQKVVMLK